MKFSSLRLTLSLLAPALTAGAATISKITTVAGNGSRGDGPEGDPLKGVLNRPHGVFVDPDGAVFIGDTETYRVRVVR